MATVLSMVLRLTSVVGAKASLMPQGQPYKCSTIVDYNLVCMGTYVVSTIVEGYCTIRACLTTTKRFLWEKQKVIHGQDKTFWLHGRIDKGFYINIFTIGYRKFSSFYIVNIICKF